MYIPGTLLVGRNYETTAVQLRSLNFFVIINSNQFLAKKADINRGGIKVTTYEKTVLYTSSRSQISIVIRELAFGFHLYYALSVKVPFYKSSIPFRLLNRDKFSFRPHVFFGVVKVVFRKKYFETNKTES